MYSTEEEKIIFYIIAYRVPLCHIIKQGVI